MLRYSLIYGGIIGAVVIALMSLTLFTMGPNSFAASELMGYATMIAVLSLVFVGIKRYRDIEQGGVIKFSQAASVGIGIAVVAAVIYAISWEAVLIATDFAFIESYSQSLIDGIKAEGLAAADEAGQVAEIEANMAMYRNPLFRLPITFIEIFPVGLVVALISALILRNANVLPARSRA
ncbi:DUF4199 domain-containing protein [Qipengyuania sp. ASV99]|uniref:DUF4199 domain-containing protein n=1 Tax=Qipengyuania sp. ASV99 TaxID=3399681 RepID=UPI003A4C50A1